MTNDKKPHTSKMPLPSPVSKNRLALLRGILLAVGMLCLLLGVCFDGVQAVVANAIALCMSCIGLG